VIDWNELFAPSHSLLELFLRGSVVYLGTLALLRIFRRDSGELSRADLLLVIMVADAAQNGMAGEYRSITEGLVLVATLFGWNLLLDWLSYRSEFVHRLLEPPPLLLIRDGRPLKKNLHAEMLTLEDLKQHLREQGLERFDQVKRAYVESDGRVSVIRRDGGPSPKRPDRGAH
jgi:uncharacterized membrane protein YcaP (DUF421 family)